MSRQRVGGVRRGAAGVRLCDVSGCGWPWGGCRDHAPRTMGCDQRRATQDAMGLFCCKHCGYHKHAPDCPTRQSGGGGAPYSGLAVWIPSQAPALLTPVQKAYLGHRMSADELASLVGAGPSYGFQACEVGRIMSGVHRLGGKRAYRR